MLNKLKLTQTKFRLNGKEINLTADNTIIKSNNLNIDKYGNIKLKSSDGSSTPSTSFEIQPISGYVILKEYFNKIDMYNESADTGAYIGVGNALGGNGVSASIGTKSNSYSATLTADEDFGSSLSIGQNGGNWSYVYPDYMRSNEFRNSSLEEIKKNINLYKNSCLNIIHNSSIYEYNLKIEKDNDKKHIGFIIGEKYKTPNEVITKSNDSIDIYSMISICWKAIQEQQEIIEQLQEKIKELEEK